MSKEEVIVALNAMLEQGNQLRASKLIPVLVEIVNSIPEGGGGVAPMVVEGTVNGGMFTPNPGQPTYEEALNCYSNGGVVLFSYNDEGETFIEHVISGIAELRTNAKMWQP